MVQWGLVFGVVVCGLESFDGAFLFKRVWTTLVVLSASFISTSFAGMAIYVMSRGTVLISRVGGFPLHVTSHGFGVLSTGKFLVKAYAWITALYLVYAATAPTRPGWIWSLEPKSVPIIVWAVSVAVFVILMFIAPQVSIHRAMRDYKARSLVQVDRKLQEALDEFIGLPSKENGEKVKTFRDLRDDLVRLPEWPFSIRNLLGVAGLSMSSALPAMWKVLSALLPDEWLSTIR